MQVLPPASVQVGRGSPCVCTWVLMRGYWLITRNRQMSCCPLNEHGPAAFVPPSPPSIAQQLVERIASPTCGVALVAAAGGVPVAAALAQLRLERPVAAARGGLLLVGPEGDFTQTELKALVRAGAVPVGLGTNRLRVETAALALLAAALLCGSDE